MDFGVSFPLAFLAGLVSFLSPCVFPLVPSYLAVVSGLTFEELSEGEAAATRTALLSSLMFVLGFALVFMSLGAAATAAGQALGRALPWIQRVGGVVVIVMGLHMLGAFRSLFLSRERRFHAAARPTGPLGALLAGIVFGAGWSPCIGPVLATILFMAGMEGSIGRGSLLLGTYAIGLGVPFVAAALGLRRFLRSSQGLRRWSGPLQRVAGTFLVLVGLLLVTGRFAALTATLAQMGQLITLEP
ncbi:MAG: cytochrome c biogenesis protein CcdA [Gemmatimonadota bacterium]